VKHRVQRWQVDHQQLGEYRTHYRQHQGRVAEETDAEQRKTLRAYRYAVKQLGQDEQWASAYTNYQNALDQGELEEPSRVSLLAGIAAYRAGNNDNAKRALEIAAEDEDLAAQAESILRELR
jgi:hypothetical protein